MHIHVPKEKRTKFDPSGRKGVFIGYIDTSKAYRIYFLEIKKIKIIRDVTFDEDSTYFRSRRTPIQEVEEPEEMRVQDMEIGEAIPKYPEDHDMKKSQESVQTFLEMESHNRKPTWEQELLREAERYCTLEGMHRDRKRAHPYNSYVALLCDIIDKYPSTYEEATKNKEWKYAMIEEYQSIMNNDVWEVVPRPENKFVVNSKWIYKINHAADGSIYKFKERFIERGFS